MRRKAFSTSLALLVWITLAISRPGTAGACSCRQLTAAEYVANSHTIFEGTAVSRQQTNVNGLGIDFYEFRVARYWKGSAYTTTVVRTSASGASCGRLFEIGKTYLLLVYLNTDGELTDGLCGGTGLLEERQSYLALLGEALSPPPPPTVPPPPSDPKLEEQPPSTHQAGYAGCAMSVGDKYSPLPLVFIALALLGLCRPAWKYSGRLYSSLRSGGSRR